MRCPQCANCLALEDGFPLVTDISVDKKGVVHAVVEVECICTYGRCAAVFVLARSRFSRDHGKEICSHDCSKANVYPTPPREPGRLTIPNGQAGISHIRRFKKPRQMKISDGEYGEFVATCSNHTFEVFTERDIEDGGCPRCFRDAISGGIVWPDGVTHLVPRKPRRTGAQAGSRKGDAVAFCARHRRAIARTEVVSGGCLKCIKRGRKRYENEFEKAEREKIDARSMTAEDTNVGRTVRKEKTSFGEAVFYGIRVEYEVSCLACSEPLTTGRFEDERRAALLGPAL